MRPRHAPALSPDRLRPGLAPWLKLIINDMVPRLGFAGKHRLSDARTSRTTDDTTDDTMLPDLAASLDRTALANFIDRYEAGRVQRRPRLRFVDRSGRACPAAALAGAETSAGFMNGASGRRFRGGVLERISRAFEDGDLDAGDLYRECLLELARRDDEPQATARKSRSSLSPIPASSSRI